MIMLLRSLGILSLGFALMLSPDSLASKPVSTTPRVKKVQGVPILPAVAMDVWGIKARSSETTVALEKRLDADVRKLFSGDRNKLSSADSGWWRTINYLRAVPYDQLSEPWKKWCLENIPNGRLTADHKADLLRRVENTPLHKMTPKQAEVWLAALHLTESNFRNRVVAIARKNLGQPYKMYLLGEYPYEIHDQDPTFDLAHGDCVVFSEHTYAMALSPDWNSFYRTLQRLRYKDGVIGMTTRNHFTVADWDKNNSWLVEDITRDLGASTVTVYTEKIDRSKFFQNFGIGQDIPVETIEDAYIPAAAIAEIESKLQPGDFVNVVRGRPNGGAWVGHVGLIGRRADGTTTFIHSTEPRSIEQPLQEYVQSGISRAPKLRKDSKPEFLGLKFLRLNDAPKIPGIAAKP